MIRSIALNSKVVLSSGFVMSLAFAVLAPIACLAIENTGLSKANPPVGHTVSIGQMRPVMSPLTRPSAIIIRSSAMCVPVSSPLKIRAEVRDQFGQPVKDGTFVSFWSGTGLLSNENVKSDKGYATTTLTGTIEGPARLLASCGMVQASASLYFFGKDYIHGALMVDDNLRDGYGIGKVESGKPMPGEGFLLSSSRGKSKSSKDQKKAGIFYNFAGLKAGYVEVEFSSLAPCDGIESILSLRQKKENGVVRSLLDLRRGVSEKHSSAELWLIRAAGGVRNRAVGKFPSSRKGLTLTLEWDRLTVVASVSDKAGRKLFKTSLALKSELPAATELWLFGRKDQSGPESVLIHSVSVHGR